MASLARVAPGLTGSLSLCDDERTECFVFLDVSRATVQIDGKLCMSDSGYNEHTARRIMKVILGQDPRKHWDYYARSSAFQGSCSRILHGWLTGRGKEMVSSHTNTASSG